METEMFVSQQLVEMINMANGRGAVEVVGHEE